MKRRLCVLLCTRNILTTVFSENDDAPSCDFRALFLHKHKFKLAGDFCAFKFLQRIVVGNFMRLQNETSVFKFLQLLVVMVLQYCILIIPPMSLTLCRVRCLEFCDQSSNREELLETRKQRRPKLHRICADIFVTRSFSFSLHFL